MTRAQLHDAQERINERTGRNLAAAIVVGVLLGGVVLASLIVVKWLFVPLAVAGTGFALYEITTAMRTAGWGVPRIPVIAAGVTVPAFAYFGGATMMWLAFLVACILVVLWRAGEAAVGVDARRSWRSMPADASAGVLALSYVALFAAFAALLVSYPRGEWWVIGCLIIVVVCDTAALAAGVLFGRHKLAPAISPGKTWEGVAGAVVAALLAAASVSVLLLGHSWALGVVFGVAIVVTSVLGDLAESLLKRDLHVKDFSSILPGHGGFLDRLDSVLPSLGVALVLYQALH